MKCPHCGAENPDNGVFCQKCNKWILTEVYIRPEAETIAPAVNRKSPAAAKSKGRRWLIPVIAVLCSIILGVVILLTPDEPADGTLPPNLSTTPPIEQTTSVPVDVTPLPEFISCQASITAYNIDGKLAFVVDDQLIRTDYNTKTAQTVLPSADGRCGAYLTGENQLLYISGTTVTEICNYAFDFTISATGNAIAYTTGEGLFLYHADLGGSILICALEETTDYYKHTILDMVLSPDGKSLAYLVQLPSHGPLPDRCLMLYVDGQGEREVTYLIQDTDLLTVNNNSDRIFLIYEGMLRLIQPDGSIVNMSTLLDRTSIFGSGKAYLRALPTVYFSADHNQVLYYNNVGTYLYTDGEKSTLVSIDNLVPITPALTSTTKHGTIAVTLPYKDITQALYWFKEDLQDSSSDGFKRSIVYLDEDDKVQILQNNVDKFFLDASGRNLFCLGHDYVLTKQSGRNPDQLQTLATRVQQFKVCNDSSMVYYIAFNTLHRTDCKGMDEEMIQFDDHLPLLLTSGEQDFSYYLKDTLYCPDETVSGVSEPTITDSGVLYFRDWLTNSICVLMDGQVKAL